MTLIHKSQYIAGAFLSGILLLTSCTDFTEIDPKGKNLLGTVSDLEQLLNLEYDNISISDMQAVSGDMLYFNQPASLALRPSVKTTTSILYGWDEDGHKNELPLLISSDGTYDLCYRMVGRVAGPILQKIDAATGADSDKAQVKGEALTMRALFHYIAVNKFAPAYEKSNAANKLAIAYMKENAEIMNPTVPIKLDEFYKHIIADLDEAIAIEGFSDTPINRMRYSKAFAHAIRAQVYMSMQEYDKAMQDANKALEMNKTIVNYYDNMMNGTNSLGETYKMILRPKLKWVEDYFHDYSLEFYRIRPLLNDLEDGHAIKDHFNTTNAQSPDRDPSEERINVPGLIVTYDLNSSWPVIGLSTSHMYLILAECAINGNKIDDAMGYLDIIREKRIDADVYTPLKGTVTTKSDAIAHLKQTANGEQFYNIWSFITKKRWTRLADYKETYHRILDGVEMSLSPDSRLWTFPIPSNIVNMNSNYKPYLND